MIRITNVLPHDLQQIIDLQRANLRENIGDTARMEEQGFVVARYDVPFLERLYTAEPPVVAYDGEKVAGYCLPVPLDVAESSPFLKSTAQIVAQLNYAGKPLTDWRYCLMGQICIAESHRGIGLFDKLYLAMRAQLQGRYDLVITEVSHRNKRSMRAHQRIGYEIIHNYEHDEPWAVVAWKI